MVTKEDIIGASVAMKMGANSMIPDEVLDFMVNTSLAKLEEAKPHDFVVSYEPRKDIVTVQDGEMFGTIYQHNRENGIYGKIFNNAPDVGFLDLMKQSMKDKPFIVQVPSDIGKNLFDIVSKATNDIALKALQDADCKEVLIAYVKS